MRIFQAKVSSISIPDNYPRDLNKINSSLPNLKSQYMANARAAIPVSPILVAARRRDEYVLVNGIKRLAGAKECGEEFITAIAVPGATSKHSMFMNIINDSGSNPMEIARAMDWLSRSGLNPTEIAELSGLGNSGRTAVNMYLRLLKLPQRIIELIEDDRLGFELAVELIGLEEHLANRLGNYSVEDGLSVTALKEIKSRWLNKAARRKPIDVDDRLQDNERYINLLNYIFDSLGVTGDFRFSESGLKLTLNINTIESFTKIVEKLTTKKGD